MEVLKSNGSNCSGATYTITKLNVIDVDLNTFKRYLYTTRLTTLICYRIHQEFDFI